MPSVTFDHVYKRFGDTRVVEDFDLTVANGELLVLVGGSGSGKSTILRMLAGLEQVTSGTIRIDDRDVTALALARARRGDGLSGLRAVSPHDGARESLARTTSAESAAAGDRPACRVGGVDPRARTAAGPQAEAAVRRPAAARRDGTCNRTRAVGISLRRATVESGRRDCARKCASRSAHCNAA